MNCGIIRASALLTGLLFCERYINILENYQAMTWGLGVLEYLLAPIQTTSDICFSFLTPIEGRTDNTWSIFPIINYTVRWSWSTQPEAKFWAWHSIRLKIKLSRTLGRVNALMQISFYEKCCVLADSFQARRRPGSDHLLTTFLVGISISRIRWRIYRYLKQFKCILFALL